jgi:HAMP domain-containing protein
MAVRLDSDSDQRSFVMSLRSRLIIAFLCLSAVPLSAITAFWYASSVSAFERAAEREAAQTASEIGRRMELVTNAVGRRMDRMFGASADPADPNPERLESRIAMLGDAAMLVDQVEFHPLKEAPPAPSSAPSKPPPPPPAPVPGAAAGVADVHPAPPVPKAPKTIVVDVRKAIDEARRTAKAGAAAGGVDISPLLDEVLAGSMTAAEAGIAAVAESAAQEAAGAQAFPRVQVELSGREIEVPVWKAGKVVGKASAVMNLDRTLGSVLALARRDQGEIPFAIDQRGTLYTDTQQRATLERLEIARSAHRATEGAPARLGDWIVVARKDPTGLVFGIARPIGESLREIRRTSWRNLAIGLGVIVLACIGIVPISHRMTQHVSSLSAGVRQLAGGDFKARVPVRSRDEFGALASAFNSMAADLERHQALVVEQERMRRELERGPQPAVPAPRRRRPAAPVIDGSADRALPGPGIHGGRGRHRARRSPLLLHRRSGRNRERTWRNVRRRTP